MKDLRVYIECEGGGGVTPANTLGAGNPAALDGNYLSEPIQQGSMYKEPTAKVKKEKFSTSINKKKKRNMKDLREQLNESLLNEAKYDLKAWETALKFMKDETNYGNYSQIWGFEGYAEHKDLESLDDFKSQMSDHTPEVEKLQKKLRGTDAWEILYEIASFLQDNYDMTGGFAGYCYRDNAYEAGEWKSEHVLNNDKKVDFGVEEEDYYRPFEFVGPSSLKKAAQVIAKYADCTSDYNAEYEMQFKIYGDLDKKDAKKFQKDLNKVKFEVQEDYTEYDEEDMDYVSVDVLAYGTRNDIEEFASKWGLDCEDWN